MIPKSTRKKRINADIVALKVGEFVERGTYSIEAAQKISSTLQFYKKSLNRQFVQRNINGILTIFRKK